jgi:hypothetical protein
MKRLLLAAGLAFGMAGLQPAAALAAAKPAKAAPQARSAYECKMDKIMMATPGKCPICGMQLTKLSPAKAATAKYECKMDHLRNVAGGKCPICGMKMTPIAKK